MKRACAIAAILFVALLIAAPPAEANPISGVGKILMGVLQLPLSILTGTFSGPPVVGTVIGTINGVTQGLGLVANGVFELVGDGVAVAKAVGPYLIPVFL